MKEERIEMKGKEERSKQKRKGSSVDKKGERRKEENKIEKEKRIEEERKKWGEKKREIFLACQRSNLDGPRVKVYPCNESYEWVPKSGSFVKLQEVENFLTLIIFSLNAM